MNTVHNMFMIFNYRSICCTYSEHSNRHNCKHSTSELASRWLYITWYNLHGIISNHQQGAMPANKQCTSINTVRPRRSDFSYDQQSGSLFHLWCDCEWSGARRVNILSLQFVYNSSGRYVTIDYTFVSIFPPSPCFCIVLFLTFSLWFGFKFKFISLLSLYE